MPPGTRTSPRSKAVPRLAIEQAESFLQELPKREKENLSVSEAIGGMADTVRAALAKGYSYNEISEMLSDKLGISVSAWSLRRYIPAGTRRGKRSAPVDAAVAPKRRRKKADGAPAVAQAIATPTTVVEEVSPAPAVEAPEPVAPTRSRTRGKATAKSATEAKPAAKTRATRAQTATKKPAAAKAKTPAKSTRKPSK